MNDNINKKYNNLKSEIISLVNDKWKKYINKAVQIRSKFGKKNLDVEGGILSNSTNIQIWDNNGCYNQKFNIIENIDGTVSFIIGKFVIDCTNGEAKCGTNVQIYESNGSKAQRFKIIDRGNDWYSIHSSINTDFCLDVNGGVGENGRNIQLYLYNESDSQLFKFIE